MSKFRTRPGVVLTQICGEHVLVSANAVLDDCPFVTTVNEESAYLWELLKDGADEDGLMRAIESEFDVEDPAAMREAIGAFLRQMKELRLILEE